MRSALFIAVIACLYLFASNEDYKDQLVIAAERSCLAIKYGERTTSERRKDGSVQCTVHENVGHALVPRLKYAEVWAR
jgi:hypothetical protein